MTMNFLKSLVVGMVLLTLSILQIPAQVLFSDGFESYTAGNNPLDKNVAGPNAAPNGSGNPWFGPVPPNLRVMGTTRGGNPAPVPVTPTPYPQLEKNCSSAGQPASASPLAGALTDLHTYTQWSWPLDGATAAYYGYDVNVEFVESYVNALYTAFSRQSVDLSLHFRCVDRNNNHTLLVPNAIHVPSIPQQGALAAGAETVPLPSYIPQTPIPIPRWRIDTQQQALLE